MPFVLATQVGPYELGTLLGAGGMGEVYRARDTRLDREVALKVLPESFAGDAARLERFHQEARMLAALNHPNVVAIYDVGTFEGKPYIVSELLNGKTLRERLNEGPLSVRKAIEYATEIAQGLAAAHEKDVVHRDLKPENIFVTADGHIKILDFGLARVRPVVARSANPLSATTVADTQPGVVMGTVGYMSPEQVKGKTVDFRSDIFSFGSVFYEMVTGKRAFHRNSGVETMNAILNDEPVDVIDVRPSIPPAVDRILRHCLEKEPQHRFQSSRDLAFDLATLSSVSDSSTRRTTSAVSRSLRKILLASGVTVLLIAATAFLLWPEKPVRYEQLTFRRGYVYAARFTPGGQGVAYSAAWSGDPSEIFSANLENNESRPLGLRDAELLGISQRGELAVLLRPQIDMSGFLRRGTLGVVNMSGGTAPREIVENVEGADWSPDGNSLVVLRTDSGNEYWIEYPVGKVIYRSPLPAWLTDVRISRSGNSIAAVEHPARNDDRGRVIVLDLQGGVTFQGPLWNGVFGLTWKSERELIVSAIPNNRQERRQLVVLNLNGRVHFLQDLPAEVTVHDLDREGRMLFTVNQRNIVIREQTSTGISRDLSWLDRSILDVLTPDGSTILFHEGGQGGGGLGSTYLRSTDGSPAVKLCDGYGIDLSPDRKWALVFLPTVPVQLRLVPTGPGSVQPVSLPSIEQPAALGFTRDGKGIIWSGLNAQKERRNFFTGMRGENPQWSSAPGTFLVAATNGQYDIRATPNGVVLWNYQSHSGQPLPYSVQDGFPLAVTDDGKFMDWGRFDRRRLIVSRVDLQTGATKVTMEVSSEDLSGIVGLRRVISTRDREMFVYSYTRHLSQLFLSSPGR